MAGGIAWKNGVYCITTHATETRTNFSEEFPTRDSDSDLLRWAWGIRILIVTRTAPQGPSSTEFHAQSVRGEWRMATTLAGPEILRAQGASRQHLTGFRVVRTATGRGTVHNRKTQPSGSWERRWATSSKFDRGTKSAAPQESPRSRRTRPAGSDAQGKTTTTSVPVCRLAALATTRMKLSERPHTYLWARAAGSVCDAAAGLSVSTSLPRRACRENARRSHRAGRCRH